MEPAQGPLGLVFVKKRTGISPLLAEGIVCRKSVFARVTELTELMFKFLFLDDVNIYADKNLIDTNNLVKKKNTL